jgi:hypothetical protein
MKDINLNLKWSYQNGYKANINNVHLWQTAIKYTVAELEEGYYREHKYFDDLEEALNDFKLRITRKKVEKNKPEYYKALKNKTLKHENIIKTSDGYYRFINREDQLLTTGFKLKKTLLKYINDFLFISSSIQKMKTRYKKLIGE